MSKNIGIVGGGIAGDSAAFAARRMDPHANVSVFTKDPYPLYSACVLADYISGEITRDHVILRDVNEYRDNNINLVMSADVKEWDRERSVLKYNDREIPCDRLILATGSRTFVPPLPGIEKKGVYSLKNLSDAEAIIGAEGKNAVVVGSGPVGIEAAGALAHRGFKVTLIELLDHILPSLFDAPVSESIVKILEEHGIDVHTGERLIEVIGDEKVKEVKTDRGTLECDVLVLVAGMRPVVDFAEKTGIRIGETGGISVSDGMRTSDNNVWACGDCVESEDRLTGKRGVYMLWNNARIQGRIAGTNAAGGSLRYPGSINVTTVDIFNTGVAAVGTMAGSCSDDEVEIIRRDGHRGKLWLVFRRGNLVGAQAIGRVNQIGGILKVLLKKENAQHPVHLNRSLEFWSLRNLKKEMVNTLK